MSPKQRPLAGALPAFSEEVVGWEWSPLAWGSESLQESQRKSTGRAYLSLRHGAPSGERSKAAAGEMKEKVSETERSGGRSEEDQGTQCSGAWAPAKAQQDTQARSLSMWTARP